MRNINERNWIMQLGYLSTMTIPGNLLSLASIASFATGSFWLTKDNRDLQIIGFLGFTFSQLCKDTCAVQTWLPSRDEDIDTVYRSTYLGLQMLTWATSFAAAVSLVRSPFC